MDQNAVNMSFFLRVVSGRLCGKNQHGKPPSFFKLGGLPCWCFARQFRLEWSHCGANMEATWSQHGPTCVEMEQK